jgi:mono/diheme cytochrome c family protein
MTQACGGGSSEPVTQVDAGRQLYKETCAVCHGPDAKGIQMLGKDLHDNEYVQSLGDTELVAFLVEGRATTHPLNERGVAMPPRGGNPSLSDEELALIGDYLRTLQSSGQ